MFNIAAATSQYALACDRKTSTGLRDSARLFQEAAGCFAHLRDIATPKMDAPRPLDLTAECASMLEKLMLAQAQECVLEKATVDGKGPATLARLAKHVAVLYDETANLLTTKPLSDHFEKSWQAHASVKSLLYHLEADLHNAADLRTKDDLRGVANEIAQLKVAQTTLTAARREAKNASKDLQDNVAEKEQAVATRLAKAERENATVYLQRVPAAADLPGVVPAALVKPVLPSELSSGGTTESSFLFKSVVPEATTKALSKYTQLVDTLVRTQTDALADASDEARIRLREWELPESLQALEPGSTAGLSDAVRMDLEKVESAGGVGHMHDLIAQIRELRQVALTELDEAESKLRDEAKDDDNLRAHYGPSHWQRPPSYQLTKHLWDKIGGYRANLAAAGDSDAKLEAKLAAEAASYATLDPLAIAATMPRLQAPMLNVLDDFNDLNNGSTMNPVTAVATIRASLESLASLSLQRASLEQELRDRRQREDLVPKLLTFKGVDHDVLFKTEMAKYDDLVDAVKENVSKQASVLETLDCANRAFRQAYNFADWRRDCDIAAAGTRSKAKSFLDMMGNMAEGVRFYSSFQEAVRSLKQQIGDFCLTRALQRDDLLQNIQQKEHQKQQQPQQLNHRDTLNTQFARMDVNGGSSPYHQDSNPNSSHHVGYPHGPQGSFPVSSYSPQHAPPPPPPPPQHHQGGYSYGQPPAQLPQSHPPPPQPSSSQYNSQNPLINFY